MIRLRRIERDVKDDMTDRIRIKRAVAAKPMPARRPAEACDLCASGIFAYMLDHGTDVPHHLIGSRHRQQAAWPGRMPEAASIHDVDRVAHGGDIGSERAVFDIEIERRDSRHPDAMHQQDWDPAGAFLAIDPADKNPDTGIAFDRKIMPAELCHIGQARSTISAANAPNWQSTCSAKRRRSLWVSPFLTTSWHEKDSSGASPMN